MYVWNYVFFLLGKRTWTCSIRTKSHRCPATIQQNGDQFRPGLLRHDHPSTPGDEIKRKIRNTVHIQALSDPYKPVRPIVEDLLRSEHRQRRESGPPPAGYPKVENLIRSTSRAKQSHRPDEPSATDLDFDLDPAWGGKDTSTSKTPMVFCELVT